MLETVLLQYASNTHDGTKLYCLKLCLLKKPLMFMIVYICTISCVIIIINYFQRKRCIFYFAINAGSCTLQNFCLKAYNNY